MSAGALLQAEDGRVWHRVVPRGGGRRLLPLRRFGKQVAKALRRGFAGSRKLYCVSFDISFPFEEDYRKKNAEMRHACSRSHD